MQSLLCRKVDSLTFVPAKVRLALAATLTALFVTIFFSAGAQSEGVTGIGPPVTSCPAELIKNAGFELPVETPGTSPLNWSIGQWLPSAQLSRDDSEAFSGASSIRIMAFNSNDAWFSQEVMVQPDTHYKLTGWIKTNNVRFGAGANLSLVGTSTHTAGLYGSNAWTYVSLLFNPGSRTHVTIGARLGYSGSPSEGVAWFDDLRLTPMTPDGTNPRWKILALIYDRTDAVVTNADGVRYHMVGAMTPAEVERATLAVTQFVETDIPALTSGNMIPELTIRYPDHALTQLDRFAQASWWPSPANTAADRDLNFDSVIVIWDPRVVDQYTGTRHWIGGAAGLTPPMGVGQTYAAIIIEATGYGHRNVFKHEWGHSILFYFDATGTAPKPAVTNHANINQYVHWPTGENYVWVDETDANLIPNSIYNNQSGFTHDYYSGTTATADQPTRRLGITPEAWMLGGPVTKPGVRSSQPPIITCNADIVVASDPGACSARVALNPPAVFDACDSDLRPIAIRSDGLPVNSAYPCGQTVITWRVTNVDNLTSSCRQVVTVKDEESPAFVSAPPPVTVTTGPSATSCGVVVSEAALRGAANDPVVLDPAGDAIHHPWPWLQADVISISSVFNAESLTFTVDFVDPVLPASSSNGQGLFGSIEIDTDQNPATGIFSSAGSFFPPPVHLGVDYFIYLDSERWHPGFVDIVSREEPSTRVVGQVPIAFTEKSFTVIVPLALLGRDNGLVNYTAYFRVISTNSDRVPNGAVPATSVPAPEVIALDNCSGLVVSRSGVPANNLFPIGETIVTYTATDPSGNTASVTQTVTVIDDTVPVISGAAASPSTLWPPNHNMAEVTVSYEAADNCGILETWLSVSSNEPVDGGAELDWEIVDAHHVRLRAARSGRWGGRLYTITITAKDVHGNLSSQSVNVSVPRGKWKGGFTVWEIREPRPGSPATKRSFTTSAGKLRAAPAHTVKKSL